MFSSMLATLHRSFQINDWHTYPPVQFWENSPSMASLPKHIHLPPLPAGLFTRSWWYWHRQELVNDSTRPEWWPLPQDLLWAVVVAIVYTAVRYLFNIAITPVAVSAMRLEPQPRLHSKNRPPPSLMPYIKQYSDLQLKVKQSKKKYLTQTQHANNSSTLEGSGSAAMDADHSANSKIQSRLYEQHQLKQLYSQALAELNKVEKSDSKDKEVNNVKLREWIADYQADRQRTNKLRKFKSAAWLFTAYFTMFMLGSYVSLTKDYVWDLSLLWKNWPTHRVPPEAFAYYLVETAHYLHMLVAEFFDIKKKDFVQMTIHHTVTLFLLFFSYMMNFTRIGVLVLVIHDASDVFLELAKLCNYSMASLHSTFWQDAFFCLFAVVFLFTRLYIYPFYIFHAALIRSQEPGSNLGMAPVYWVFNGLLGSLIVLHVIWGSIILNMVRKFLSGGIQKDERSDSDEEEEVAAGVNGGADNNLDGPVAPPSTASQLLHTPRKLSQLDKIVDSPKTSGKSRRLKGA